jgi:hypothetical protein
MQYMLAGSRIRLDYLQDRRALAAIDWPAVLDDLIEAGAPPRLCHWNDLDRLTHVVLATDRSAAQYVGMLGLIEHATKIEPWLLIDVAMVKPGETGVMLRRAMLAHVLARVVCLDGKPAALASPSGDRSIEAALRDLGLKIREAEMHPPADGNVVVFKTASLAHRIGTGRALLDLRPVPETSLLRDLRGMHGGRPETTKHRTRKVIAKPAKTAGATRRPKKATRTGRNG